MNEVKKVMVVTVRFRNEDLAIVLLFHLRIMITPLLSSSSFYTKDIIFINYLVFTVSVVFYNVWTTMAVI
jgi:hypothetical protein